MRGKLHIGRDIIVFDLVTVFKIGICILQSCVDGSDLSVCPGQLISLIH